MYKLNTYGITRLADNASIPADPANTDYAEYLEWAKTNTAAPQFTPAEILANIKRDTNSAIEAQMAAARPAIVDALLDGNVAKISALRTAQAALKSQLIT